MTATLHCILPSHDLSLMLVSVCHSQAHFSDKLQLEETNSAVRPKLQYITDHVSWWVLVHCYISVFVVILLLVVILFKVINTFVVHIVVCSFFSCLATILEKIWHEQKIMYPQKECFYYTKESKNMALELQSETEIIFCMYWWSWSYSSELILHVRHPF